LVTFKPFSFELNISSFDTDANFDSDGALPVVFESWANAGLERIASEAAAINAIFFMTFSSLQN